MSIFGLLGGLVGAAGGANSFEKVKDTAPNKIGVYLMYHKGRVMYVGRAVEERPGQSTKGQRKRLKEHWRGAGSCKAELHRYRDDITVKLKICSCDCSPPSNRARLPTSPAATGT